jgi:hypothetical protein
MAADTGQMINDTQAGNAVAVPEWDIILRLDI